MRQLIVETTNTTFSVFDEPRSVPAPSLRLTTLSPHAARILLNRLHPQARRDEELVRVYSRAMRDGCWINNGSPIVLSTSKKVLDGVQRLLACVETRIPLETLVAENIEDEAFAAIDQHHRRTFSGVLKSLGFGYPRLLSSLLYLLLRYDFGPSFRPGTSPLSWTHLLRVVRNSPAPLEAVATAASMPSSKLPLLVRAALIFMGYQVDRNLTNRLLLAEQEPDRFSVTEPGVLLRLEIDRVRTREVDNATLLALSIKALNAALEGKELRRLNMPRSSQGEAAPLPRLRGYAGLTGLITPIETSASRMCWSVERIDPETAARYLSLPRYGRLPVQPQVDSLAQEIRAGRWRLCGQPICFAEDGRLLNGQHRLLAVLAAGQAIESFVVSGLTAEAAATYDFAPRRNLFPVQAEKKFGDQALVIAMANLLWRFEMKTPSTKHRRASRSEIADILRNHPRLMELRSFARRMVEYGRSSVMGYGAYVIERDDPDLAEQFLHALSTGADLAAGHPVLGLRSQLQRLRRDEVSQEEQLAALLAGWRRYKTYITSDR